MRTRFAYVPPPIAIDLRTQAAKYGISYRIVRRRYLNGIQPPALYAPEPPKKPKRQSIVGINIEHDSQILTLREWSHLLNIPYKTLNMRYARGMRPPQLFLPTMKTPRAKTIIRHEGIELTLQEWAQHLRLPYVPLRMRYIRGVRPPELFEPIRSPNID